MVVRVEPATVEWLEALVEGRGAFTQRFGVTVVPGWAVYPEAVVRALDAARRGDDPAWGAHLFFDDDGALVGFGGFKGPPSQGDGVVELGYAVAPSRRGNGIATAVVDLLLRRAGAAGVTTVCAHTLPTESASTTVLRRTGFTLVGEVAEAGQAVWRWERPPPGRDEAPG
jgi:[ribosomal protein S5]-alanine N-acetyltransferase